MFRKYHIEFSKIDYSLPSSEMLARAAKRYNLNLKRYLYVLPSLILTGIGLHWLPDMAQETKTITRFCPAVAGGTESRIKLHHQIRVQ